MESHWSRFSQIFGTIMRIPTKRPSQSGKQYLTLHDDWMKEPILNYLSLWTMPQTCSNNADHPCTNHYLLTKFKMATAHDPRAGSFIAEWRRLYPGDQPWDHLLNLAAEQGANLDGDSDEVRQAFVASSISVATILAAGGAAPAAIVPTAATTGKRKPTRYCFIRGTKLHHSSPQCKMVEINRNAFPYSPTNLQPFETTGQVKKAKLTRNSATKVNGIG